MYVLVWDKQWKVQRNCLEKFALGRSRGQSDSFSDFWIKIEKIAAQRCPSVNSDHIPILPSASLTVVNPDITRVILKSAAVAFTVCIVTRQCTSVLVKLSEN